MLLLVGVGFTSLYQKDRRFLICDGDVKFRYRFKIVMEAAGIKLIKTPLRRVPTGEPIHLKNLSDWPTHPASVPSPP
ncbi:MAG: hypothetical protein GY711_23060 [bacterium]|nr:hypothetical protein [bacterium]